MNKDIILMNIVPTNQNSNSFSLLKNRLSESIIKAFINKEIIFKLTDDITDIGLLGVLEDYKNNQLIIRRDGVLLVFKTNEIYYLEEYIAK